MSEVSEVSEVSEMSEVAQIGFAPKPPATSWERYTLAAARSGVTPRVYLDIVNSDPKVRVLRLGKRGLLHVAREDADEIAHRLMFGGVRQSPAQAVA